MAAERGTAAALDGRHHLQLAEADVPGVGTLSSAGSAERQRLQRASHITQRAGSHVTIACRVLEPIASWQ
jgi:hypothetical protein